MRLLNRSLAVWLTMGAVAAVPACGSKEDDPPKQPGAMQEPGPNTMMPGVMGNPTAGSSAMQPTGGSTPGGMVGTMGGSGGTPPGDVGGSNGGQTPAGGGGGAGGSTPPAGGAGGSEPGTPGVSEWTMMGYDLASTYNNTAERKLTKANAATLTEAYVVEMGSPVYGAPLQVGDKIYASGAGSVVALDAATGMQVWKHTGGGSGSLAFDKGTLYLNTAANVIAIDASNGMRKWMKRTHTTQTADGSSSPLVAGDVVLVGGSNGGIELSTGNFRGFMTALNAMSGDQAWSTFTAPDGAKGASIWSSPAADLAENRAYGSTGNNYGPPASDTSDAIIAFDLKTGGIIWKAQAVKDDTFALGNGKPDADFGANPVLFEAMVEGQMTKLAGAGCKGGVAMAVRRDTGAEVWKRTLCMGQADGSRGIFVNSTWDGKNLLVACNEGGPATLYALDGGTGNVTWMRALPAQVWGRMSVANGVGFVGTGTKLEVFDTADGKVLTTINSKGGTVAGTITIANGRVAFGEGLTWSSGVRGTKMTVLTVK